MPRVSNAVKAKYRPINEGSEQCFYCPSPSYMDDLSPNPKASAFLTDEFPDEWTIAKVCTPCWSRIYEANKRFHRPWCMTVEDKKKLLSGVMARPGRRAELTIAAKAGCPFLIPTTAMLFEEGIVLYSGEAYQPEEILELQGCLALKALKRPVAHVEHALRKAIAVFGPEREVAFRTLLEMNDEDAD